MIINYLKTIGFRKFKEVFETELYDITNITGMNRAGKTNILYAIVNIMLGTNLSGDEKACLINKDCDKSYGELHFTDNNGQKHILIRSKSRYSSKENYIALDGKPVTQTEITDFYKDKKLFLSILNPLYFLSKKSSEQKEMVDKYLSNISPDEICMDIAYNNLSEDEKNILEGVPKNIPSYIAELNSNIKNAEKNIVNLDGKIQYAQNIADEILPNLKVFDKDEELTLAKQELSYLSSNGKIINKEAQKKFIEDIEKSILDKETELNEIEKHMKTGKQTYLSIINGSLCACPTCNQNIQDKSKEITIRNMKNDLISKYDKKNVMETQLKDLKFKLSFERCKYHALEVDATIKKEKRIAVVEEFISKLEQEKQGVDRYNSEILIKEKNIQTAKQDIEKFNKEKQSKLQLIDSLIKAKKVAQKLYIACIEKKMKVAKTYLKDVDIKFYSVLKTTGEIKDDFIITYKNNQLSDLSRSETIATALEFANMFNKIANVNFPIYIDDYESCADYNFVEIYGKDTQLIVSKVEKGQPLKIENGNGNKVTTNIQDKSKTGTVLQVA